MAKGADVQSIDALGEAKVAVVEFLETVKLALSEGSSDVQRTITWLQSEKRTFWHHEVRRRTEKVNQAKSELFRAQLEAQNDRISCLEEKKLLERAERGLAEAEQKVKLVQKWSRLLEREAALLKGRCQPLARAVEGDLPRGVARLELLIGQLHAYVNLREPGAHPGATRSARLPGKAGDPDDAPVGEDENGSAE